MVRFLIRRLLAMVPLLLVITGSVFMLGQYGSGDLAMTLTMRMTDNNYSEEVYKEMVVKLHQDEPVLQRFGRFVSDAFHGDFGISYVLQGTPDIGRMISTSMPLSIQLGLDAILLVIFIGVPLGIAAAAWRNTPIDYTIVGVVTILSSIPPFVLAPIALVVLVAQLHIIPTVSTGWNGMFSREAILPAACLAVGPMLGVVRFTRASVIDTLSQEYIRAARARGLNEISVIVQHVIKNSMTPVLTIMGVTVGRLLSGSIFIETVFGIQGIGSVAVLAFQSGDIQTVAATTLVTASLVMVSNLMVDMLYGVLDPRVRLN